MTKLERTLGAEERIAQLKKQVEENQQLIKMGLNNDGEIITKDGAYFNLNNSKWGVNYDYLSNQIANTLQEINRLELLLTELKGCEA